MAVKDWSVYLNEHKPAVGSERTLGQPEGATYVFATYEEMVACKNSGVLKEGDIVLVHSDLWD